MKRLLLIGAAALVLAALIADLFLRGGRPVRSPGRTTIIVKEGATLAVGVAPAREAGRDPGQRAVPIMSWRGCSARSDPIQAGEFEIPKGMGGAAILDLLQHGKPLQRLITVTEGMPSIIVQEKLAANPLSDRADAADRGGLACCPTATAIERGETRAALVKRMQPAMTKTLAELWPKRSGDCPVATPEQAVILASIVEKETGKAAERPMIAGVYCNRLKIGMKLDADPTVIYPVTKGKPLGRRIKKSELDADNGYNTYQRAGPAGRTDRQSGQGEHRGGASPGADQGAVFRRRRHRRPRVRRDVGAAQCERRQMVCDPPSTGTDVRNRGIGRGRMFMGALAAARGRDYLGDWPDDEPARRDASPRAPSTSARPSWV